MTDGVMYMANSRPGRLSLRALASAIAQEPLDVGDEVVAGREALLVDHRLEALDVRPGRLLERGGGVEARPQLVRLLGEVARRASSTPRWRPSASSRASDAAGYGPEM